MFEKVANNPYTISIGVIADASVCMLSDIYSPDGTGVSNYATLASLGGFILRRNGIIGRENSVVYGIWAGKLAASQLKNLRVEHGNSGFWGRIFPQIPSKVCNYLAQVLDNTVEYKYQDTEVEFTTFQEHPMYSLWLVSLGISLDLDLIQCSIA